MSTKEYGQLLSDDTMRVVGAIPRKVGEWMVGHGGMFVAGGFVRSIVSNEKPSDLDIFTTTGVDATTAASDLIAGMDGPDIYVTNFAVTIPASYFGVPVQIIERWKFDTVEKIMDHFDFTIAQAAVYYDARYPGTNPNWKSCCSHQFYQDLATRRLRYSRHIMYIDDQVDMLDAGGTMLRVLKYTRKGFNISPEDLAQIMWEVTRGDLLPHDIIAVLREVDPSTIPSWITESLIP